MFSSFGGNGYFGIYFYKAKLSLYGVIPGLGVFAIIYYDKGIIFIYGLIVIFMVDRKCGLYLAPLRG